MGFFRIYPSKDTYITNLSILSTAMTASNHGKSPSLNVFSFKNETSPNSIDTARSLVQFDLSVLSSSIYSSLTIPSSSVSYYLKMFNLVADDTLPASFDIDVMPISRSWDNGNGIDDENCRDTGVTNWINPVSLVDWVVTGSDYLTQNSSSQHFDEGNEDLCVDVTHIVKSWLTGAYSNNGFLLKLANSQEDAGDFYRKVFHSKESMYVDRIPYLEARWDDTIKDHRSSFIFDQPNNLYLYNIVRGTATNLTEPIFVRVQDSLSSASIAYSFTASFVSTGIYKAVVTLSSSVPGLSSSWRDIWFSGSASYLTGTFRPVRSTGSQVDLYEEYTIDVNNLKRVYSSDEEARLYVNVTKRDFVTHFGNIHSASLNIGPELEKMEKMYYSVANADTNETVVPFGTGSLEWTKLSYDNNGNYFNISMNSFVPGHLYKFLFLIQQNKYDKKIYDNNYLFKVV